MPNNVETFDDLHFNRFLIFLMELLILNYTVYAFYFLV